MSKELELLQKDVQVLYDFARQYCDLIDLNPADTINCNKERLDNYFKVFDQIQNADLSEAENDLEQLISVTCDGNRLLAKVKQSLKKAKLVEEKLKILFNKKTTATNYLVTLNELEEMFKELVN